MGSNLTAQQKHLASHFKNLLRQHEESFTTRELKKFTKKVDLICPWLQKDRPGTIDLALWDSIGEALQADLRASVKDQILWSKIRMSLARLNPNNVLLSQEAATKIFNMGDLTPVTTKQTDSLSTTEQSQVNTTQPQLLLPPDLDSVPPVLKGPLEQIETELPSTYGQNVPLGPEQTSHLNSPPGPGETIGEIEQKVATDDALKTTTSGHQPASEWPRDEENPDYDWFKNGAWELKLADPFYASVPCSVFSLFSASVSSPISQAASLPTNSAFSKDFHVTSGLVSLDANASFSLHIWVQNTQQLKAEETFANLQQSPQDKMNQQGDWNRRWGSMSSTPPLLDMRQYPNG